MAVRVETVDSARKLREFQRFPWRVYSETPQWVPPLLSEEKKLLDPGRGHPFHQHAETRLFLARRNGLTTGRVAACVNHLHNEVHGEKTGFFGFFEVLEDQPSADALVQAASRWLASAGMERVRGPASYSVNETCALLVEGFDLPPSVLMSYNPPYYIGLLESAGFAPIQDMVAYRVTEGELRFRAEMATFARRMKERGGITVRSVDLKNLQAELAPVRRIYNEAWADNWGAVPMTEAEIDHLAKSLKPILRQGLVLIAEVEGEAVGFALSVPDVNVALRAANGRLLPFGIVKLLWAQRKIHSLRTIALGTLSEFRRRGVDAVLLDATIRNGTGLGFDESEMGWILEDNQAMRKPLDRVGGRVVKRYRFYEKPL